MFTMQFLQNKNMRYNQCINSDCQLMLQDMQHNITKFAVIQQDKYILLDRLFRVNFKLL